MPLPRVAPLLLTVACLCARAVATDLTISIVPRWRGEGLAVPSAAQRNDHGQSLELTRFAALLSGAALVRADGSHVRLDGQFGFINAEEKRLSWTLRNAPRGGFVGLEFQIGVPTEVNHGDPAVWPAGHPLNPLVNALHWSWQGGYVFLALEGRWRAAGGGTEAAARGFSYHLATGARATTLRFLAHFEIAGDTTVELAFDLARVLAAQRLDAHDGSESTHSAEGDELAGKLTTAVSRAWFWLGATRSHERERVESSQPLADARSHEKATPFAFIVPATFPQPALPADNPLTVEGVALGEALFFDSRLSGNGTQSCASCHAATQAFSDSVAVSRGADGAVGRRNAMPLVNLAWSPSFAWDGSQPRIRDQALAAWTNPIEMHAEPAKVLGSLAQDGAMAAQFAAAFGNAELTADRVALALEQFLLTQVSADSKFDRALRGAAEFTEDEKRGFELFATEYDPARGRRGADCFHCHGGPLFTDFGFKNNGLDRVSADAGRGAVTGSASDRGKFKTPSLRNVAVTGPYMHDGRFATLEAVVAHYDHGIQRAAALDPNIAKHPEAGLELSAEDRRALVAFLRTLTDARFEAAQASRLPSDSVQAGRPRYSSPSQ